MAATCLYVGTVADSPVRDYGLDGAPIARFLLACPADPAPGVGTGAGPDVLLTVVAAGALADPVLRDLRRGDRALVCGALSTAPPDAARRGAADLYLNARNVGLDLATAGWHRDPAPVAVGATTGFRPEYHW